MGNVQIKEFVMILLERVSVMRDLKGVHAKVTVCFCWMPYQFCIIKYLSQIGPALVETYLVTAMESVTQQRGCVAAMWVIKDWIALVRFL